MENCCKIDIKYSEKESKFVDLLKLYTRQCIKVSNLSKRKALLNARLNHLNADISNIGSKSDGYIDIDLHLELENLRDYIPMVAKELKNESRKSAKLFESILIFIRQNYEE